MGSISELIRRRYGLIAALLVILGVLLASPSLGGGLSSDDHIQRMWVRERGQCLDLFAFATGDEGLLNFQKSVGTVPFYADSRLKISFFRPLASLSHCIDYRYLDDRVRLFHLQNLAWLGIAMSLAAAIYRKTASTILAAMLAALFFAVEDAHGPAASWIANRNALMAACFGFLSLLSHDRARREGSRLALWLAPLAFLLALLSAEAGVATLAYLVAYALTLDRGRLRAAITSLSPYVGILLGWRIVYIALGHGQYGSALYTDPFASPGRFLAELGERVPVLLFAQLGGPSADAFADADLLAREAQWALAVGSCLAASVILVPLLRARASARFFGVGMLLSLFAVAATVPGDRLLLFAGLGGMGLVGETLAALVEPARELYRSLRLRIPASALGLGWLIVHGIAAPMRLPARSLVVGDTGEWMKGVSESLFADLEEKTGVVVVYADDMYACTFALFMGYTLGHAGESRGQCLYGGRGSVEIVRIGAKRLLVRPEEGFIDRARAPFWNADRPMKEGQKIDLGWSTMTVTAVSEAGEPLEVIVQYGKTFEDPTLRLRYFDKEAGAYRDLEPPPLWGSLRIRAGRLEAHGRSTPTPPLQ